MRTLYLLDLSGSMDTQQVHRFVTTLGERHAQDLDSVEVAGLGQLDQRRPLRDFADGVPLDLQPDFSGTMLANDLENLAKFVVNQPDFNTIVILTDLLDLLPPPAPDLQALTEAVALRFVVTEDNAWTQDAQARVAACLGDRPQTGSLSQFLGDVRRAPRPGRR